MMATLNGVPSLFMMASSQRQWRGRVAKAHRLPTTHTAYLTRYEWHGAYMGMRC